jgi:hypothetical protein
MQNTGVLPNSGEAERRLMTDVTASSMPTVTFYSTVQQPRIGQLDLYKTAVSDSEFNKRTKEQDV